ncbi:MAG: acyl carrier protein [Chitinivibrionales bacterium]|nr:acyl carrier protein [Chitinivibrionales bacterium]
MMVPGRFPESQIRLKIRDFLKTNFFFDTAKESFTDADSFQEKGIVDSTGILEVIGFVQKDFKIEIEDAEVLPGNLDSVDNIAAFVLKKTGPGSQARPGQ